MALVCSACHAHRLAAITRRYEDMEPKEIIKKLLGKDVSVDDPIPDGRACSSTEQVRHMLAACACPCAHVRVCMSAHTHVHIVVLLLCMAVCVHVHVRTCAVR